MNLRTLSDDELLRHAHNELDPLTSTELEAELLRRYEDNAAVTAENEPLLKVLADHDMEDPIALDKTLKALDAIGETPNAQALLDLLNDFDIDEPAALKKLLERNAKFEDLKNDLVSPLASLQQLITEEA